MCNACHRRYGLRSAYECRFYDAVMAHEFYSQRKTASREGIDCTLEDLEKMAEYVRPLLKRGQSPEFIWSHHGDELPVSLRTFYAYVEAGVFEDIVNLDLPKKVKIKVRRKPREEAAVPRHALDSREYSDFQALSSENQTRAVEMDCVCGKSGEKPAILTLLFFIYHNFT